MLFENGLFGEKKKLLPEIRESTFQKQKRYYVRKLCLLILTHNWNPEEWINLLFWNKTSISIPPQQKLNKSKCQMCNFLKTMHFNFYKKPSNANEVWLLYTPLIQKYLFFPFWQSESSTCKKFERLFVFIHFMKSTMKISFIRPQKNNWITLPLHKWIVLWRWDKEDGTTNMREEEKFTATEQNEGWELIWELSVNVKPTLIHILLCCA